MIQVGAYREIAIAENEVKSLLSHGYDAFVEEKAFENRGISIAFVCTGIRISLRHRPPWPGSRKKGIKDCFLARKK